MSRNKVLVLGGNFGGLTAALALKHELGDDVEVTVLSASDHFLFNPSLIWLPFGKRKAADITFPLAPTFAHHGVDFVHVAAETIDPAARRVRAGGAEYGYDYLVVATGYRNDLEVAPGFAESVHAITTLDGAVRAGQGWRALLEDPGPVVIGATQRASCFGAAYEFLFNTAYRLRKAGIRSQVSLTFVTSEPFLGHFGIGGLPGGEKMLSDLLRRSGIEVVLDASLAHAEPGKLTLGDGRVLEATYAMLIPPFLGQDVVVQSAGLGDEKGYVAVRDTYESVAYPGIYAVGIAAAVASPWQTATPIGVPKTGFPTEKMAHVAARNIAAQVRGEAPVAHEAFGEIPAVCILDAGNNGVILLADKMFPPRHHSVVIPGPQSHAAKLAFERYFLWKARHGYTQLP